jgi:hypothetical protein
MIPMQLSGSWVDYSIVATDGASNTTVDPPVYKYIAGTYIGYDNGVVSFLYPIPAGNGTAVRMSAPVGDDILVTALIRNYTDVSNPNDDLEFHVWTDAGGLPGADLITPFMVTPEATLENTSAMTRVDLRPYRAMLSGLTGDFHVGFTVPSGTVNVTGFSPAAANRSSDFIGAWSPAGQDYHFRTIMGNSATVPVELTSFAANVNNDGDVILNWTTATELNNQMFEIERRSEEGQYLMIGYVNGHGTTTENQEYSYVDNTVETGTYFYRLKQIDFLGTYEYSDEIEVEVKGPLTFGLEQNYPNPFNPSTHIKYNIPESGVVKLAIYNMLGEEVAVLVDGMVEAGFYEVTFDASHLPSGAYFYRLQSDKLNQVKKMLLMK